MNYIVVFRRNGVLETEFFHHREDVAYPEETWIRNEDDVIRHMLCHYHPDDGNMVIRETLLGLKDLSDEKIVSIVVNLLRILNGNE